LLAAKILRPKVLVAFFFSLTLALLVSTVIFNLLEGFNTNLSLSLAGAEEKGIAIVQDGARSVYTSSIPYSLAKSLKLLKGIETEAYTLALTVVNDHPVVVRGVEDLKAYIPLITKGSISNNSSSFVLVGERASKILGVKIGDLILAGNPTSPIVVMAKVSGIYKANDIRDYEIVMPIELANELANKPKRFVSMIVVKGMSKQKLQSLLKSEYSLEIIHPFSKGEFTILDIDGVPLTSIRIKNESKIKLKLPFGKYSLIYEDSYYVSNLSSFLLIDDIIMDLRNETKLASLEIIAPNAKVQVKDERGKEMLGERYGNSWLYKVMPGSYIVSLNNLSYTILVTADTVFDPLKSYSKIRNVSLEVAWYDGSPVTDYILIIKDSQGEVIYSASLKTHIVKLNLPYKDLEVTVYKPPYVAKATLTSNTSSLVVKLPVIANPEKIPLNSYTKIRTLPAIEIPEMTFSAFLGISISALTTLTISLSAISIFAVISIQSYLQTSARDNISVLYYLGARRIDVIKLILPITLLLSLLSAIIATVLSLLIHNFLIQSALLTIFGYGLSINPLHSILFSVLIAVASWSTWFLEIRKSSQQW